MTNLWQISHHFDPAVVRLADSHYSRKKPGSPQFCPPGRHLVLYVVGPQWPFRAWAGWAWWHPHENSPQPRRDGFQGWWCCSFFRNESPYHASDLVRQAVEVVNQEWGLPPYGYDTWIWTARVKPTMVHGKPVYGWCYRKAGWTDSGHWSKDGKKLRLYLPKTPTS